MLYPDPATTSRPDIPTANAYLIESEHDAEIVDADYFTSPFACDVERDETVTPLECVRSWDHGLRTAEGLSLSIGAECAAYVMEPVLVALGCDVATLDVYALAESTLGLSVEHGTIGADDPDAAQWLFEWSEEMMSAAGDAGFLVDTSADTGMTWLYRPLCDPIGR